MGVTTAALGCTCLMVGFAAMFGWQAVASFRKTTSTRRALRRGVGQQEEEMRCLTKGTSALCVQVMRRMTLEAHAGVRNPFLALPSVISRRCRQRVRLAGLESQISVEGMAGSRWLLCACCAAAGACAGVLFSPESAVVGGVAAAIVGWVGVPWALRCEVDRRRELLEQELSEMLEVLCLALRSGLSFDRAIDLYCRYYHGVLAYDCRRAQQLWHMGIKTREQALRDMAATYDSPLIVRFVSATTRSLRFGSTLADTLESIADDAREIRKSHIEEKVMKAPVKMMIPVGTLILPSMLLLVLGPVLLDLMEGF